MSKSRQVRHDAPLEMQQLSMDDNLPCSATDP